MVFIPLYFSVNTFLISASNEIINQWYQGEQVNIQQGNILSSISKLQRPISESKLLKGVLVKDESGNELLKLGINFRTKSLPFQMSTKPTYSRNDFSSYIYSFSESGLQVHILVGSVLPYLVASVFVIYVILIFLILGVFVRREAIYFEKLKNESEIKTLNAQKDMDDKVIAISEQVAHDIKSPLAALNIISSHFKDNLNETLEIKRIFENSIVRINSIANDLSSNSKKSDHMIDLQNLIIKLIEEKNIILLSNNFKKINFDITPQNYNKIMIAENDFSRVISNLLNNSIDAIDKTTGEINVTIKEDSDAYKLIIQDNGIGIANDVLSRLGEKGFSFGKENRLESGSGLGFFHAKKTMTTINGAIEVETNPGSGTSIILKFPLNSKSTHPINMILFEDDDLVKMSWEYYASKKSINIFIFGNYLEFLKIHEVEPFNLNTPVYADINLKSSESGIEIVKKLNTFGFSDINLTTGYDKSSIDVPIFIKKIINKTFPFV